MMFSFALKVSAQNEIKVQVPNIVAVDEQFNVTFVIEGDNSVSDFEWEPGDGFQLVWGPQKGSSSSVQIINGKTTRSSQVTYTYILLPLKSGTCTIPAASASVKGKAVSSKPVTIEVVAGSGSRQQGGQSQSSGSSDRQDVGEISSDDLFMRLELSKSGVVVGEPVRAVIKLYQRVNIAGFEDVHFPTFNGFWSQEVDTPSSVEFHRETVDGEIYNAAVLRSYVLIPQQAGNLQIDPSELVCLVNVRAASNPMSIFDSFFQDSYRTIRKRVATEARTVRVSALPSGAPASFGGGVGSFSISAKLSSDNLKAHEAASLVITLNGKGNVSLLEAPKVSFPVDFEVYDTKTTDGTSKADGRTSGSKSFEYPFIPRSHGSFEIPAIQYSYYDINSGKYVTLTTEPLQLEVAKGVESAQGSSPVSGGVLRKDVSNIGSDIRFISTARPSFDKVGSFFVLSPLYVVLLVIIGIAALACVALLRRRASAKADVALSRRRGASKVAKKKLAQAGVYLKGGLSTAFYEELHKAILGYVGDKLSMDMTDMSKENIALHLCEGGVAESLAGELTALLDACELARYAPDSGDGAMSGHYEKALSVISMIDSAYKTKKASGKVLAALAVLLMLSPSAIAASGDNIAAQLWQQGISEYDNQQWQAAVDAWKEIEESGLESAELYYNIGNAYFKNDDLAHAILYYERSLKLDPAFRDSRFNLEYASSLVQDKIESVPEFFLAGWMRSLCWTLSSDAWAWLSVLLFALCAAGVVLFFCSQRTTLRKTGFYGGIASLLLFVMSLSFAVVQKSDYASGDRAVVTTPVVSAKSAPSSDSAKDLFVIHEGTRVNILDNVGNWYNIELSDGRQGWIAGGTFEII